MVARNPYVIGVPLTDDVGFYGRQDIFRSIKDVLDAEKQNVVVLYGQRRIGKTSVLHRAGKWLEQQGVFFPVYYDLQGKERLSLGEVLENLAQTLARRLDLVRPDPARFDEEGRHFREAFLPLAFERLVDQRLVLLIDEFDVLGDELATPHAASETLFPYLHELIVNHRQIGFVFVVGRRIEELATHFQAIFKQAVYRRIGHLTAEESRSLILEPTRGVVTYSDDAVREIQRLAAGHPYFTQLICFEAFNAVRGNGQAPITADTIQNVVSRAIESGHGALNWFWEGLPRAERFILSAVAHVSDEAGVAAKESVRRLLEEHRIVLSGLELKDAPDRLVEWEMLRREGADAYQFVVEIVRRWVIQEHPLSSARRDIDYVNKRAVRLFENAREAHSQGDLDYARDEYRRTLNANPNHSGAQLGLALVLYELGQIEESIVEFEHAYAIDEMSARDGLIRARLSRAKTLEEGGRTDDAVLAYDQVLHLASSEETAARRLSAIWQTRAEAALARRDLAGAREALRNVLKRDQREETLARVQAAVLGHATTLEGEGDLDASDAAYTLLLELLPNRDEVNGQAAAYWIRRGDGLESRGQLDLAIGFYSMVLSLHPDDALTGRKRELAAQKQEERRAADRVFAEALAAHRAGRFDQARAGWKKLIHMDVYSYAGHNIATLLSETVAPPPAAPPDSEPTEAHAGAAVSLDADQADQTDQIDAEPADDHTAAVTPEGDSRSEETEPRREEAFLSPRRYGLRAGAGVILLGGLLLSLYFLATFFSENSRSSSFQPPPESASAPARQPPSSTTVTRFEEIASAHPYGHGIDQTWTFTLPGRPPAIDVTFDAMTQVEQCCDSIHVTDGAGEAITGSPFSGMALAGQTKRVAGDTVRVRLYSDGSYSSWGVAVTNVTAANTPPPPASAHPYPTSFDRTWTYTLPGNPSAIDVRFDPMTSVEPCCDRIHVMDANGMPIPGSPFAGPSLAGQTKRVPGATVRIRLTSDGSVSLWGFAVTNVTAAPR